MEANLAYDVDTDSEDLDEESVVKDTEEIIEQAQHDVSLRNLSGIEDENIIDDGETAINEQKKREANVFSDTQSAPQLKSGKALPADFENPYNLSNSKPVNNNNEDRVEAVTSENKSIDSAPQEKNHEYEIVSPKSLSNKINNQAAAQRRTEEDNANGVAQEENEGSQEAHFHSRIQSDTVIQSTPTKRKWDVDIQNKQINLASAATNVTGYVSETDSRPNRANSLDSAVLLVQSSNKSNRNGHHISDPNLNSSISLKFAPEDTAHNSLTSQENVGPQVTTTSLSNMTVAESPRTDTPREINGLVDSSVTNGNEKFSVEIMNDSNKIGLNPKSFTDEEREILTLFRNPPMRLSSEPPSSNGFSIAHPNNSPLRPPSLQGILNAEDRPYEIEPSRSSFATNDTGSYNNLELLSSVTNLKSPNENDRVTKTQSRRETKVKRRRKARIQETSEESTVVNEPNEKPDGRSRRERKKVNYALPGLRTKLRRNFDLPSDHVKAKKTRRAPKNSENDSATKTETANITSEAPTTSEVTLENSETLNL